MYADEDICAGAGTAKGQLQCAASWCSISLAGAGAGVDRDSFRGTPCVASSSALGPSPTTYSLVLLSHSLTQRRSWPERSAATAGAGRPFSLLLLARPYCTELAPSHDKQTPIFSLGQAKQTARDEGWDLTLPFF